MTAIYISVLQAPINTSGNLVLTITPFQSGNDAPQNYTVNLPIGATVTEITTARTLCLGLISAITAAGNNYSGAPTLSSASNTPPPTFRVSWSDHVVCLWSECVFSVTYTSASDAILAVGPDPLLVTNTDFNNKAQIVRMPLVDISGNILTAAEQTALIEMASGALVAHLNNPIIATSYIDTFHGFGGRMFQGRMRPGIQWDIPVARQMWQLVANTLTTNPQDLWNWNRRLNQLWFRMENALLAIFDPGDVGAEVKWSYVAGYVNIPSVIKTAVMEIARGIMTGPSARSLRVGSFEVRTEDVEKWLSSMTKTFLRKYQL